jgi:hypothetical protein
LGAAIGGASIERPNAKAVTPVAFAPTYSSHTVRISRRHLNHSTCSSLKVCTPSKSIVVPSGFTIWQRTFWPGFGRQVEHVDAVVLADQVVGGRVGEGQRQHALLLQVGLVDAGEAAHDDHLAAAEPGLHGGVLARRALAVVLVADRPPSGCRPRGSAWRFGEALVAPSSWSLPSPIRAVKALTRRGTGCPRCSRGGRGT